MNAHRWRSLVVAAIGFIGIGCSAGESYASLAESGGTYPVESSYGGEAYYEETAAMDAAPMPASAPAASRERGGAPSRQQVATNAPAGAAPQAQSGPPPTVAVDAPVQRDLIIYTADIMLAIYEVDATQRALATAATEAGGFVASLDGRTLVVRIPAAQFEGFLARIEGAGQVLGRRIQAEDVTEQFRDLQIRLENLTAMRNRLEAMLARAANVQEAIQVERELERVTVELESLRGRLRYLADRVAYSTITIRFQPLPREQLAGNVPTQLPVPWLQTLGLSTLMR